MFVVDEHCSPLQLTCFFRAEISAFASLRASFRALFSAASFADLACSFCSKVEFALLIACKILLAVRLAIFWSQGGVLSPSCRKRACGLLNAHCGSSFKGGVPFFDLVVVFWSVEEGAFGFDGMKSRSWRVFPYAVKFSKNPHASDAAESTSSTQSS